MAKKANGSGLAEVDVQMGTWAQKVKDRFKIVRQEVHVLQKEMERLSEQHRRLTGKSLLGNGSVGSSAPAQQKAGGKKRRTRMQGVTVEWLSEHLKKPMTVKQLQDAAGRASLSGLRIPAILKENKSKFKSEAGKKVEGVKGKPGMMWSLK